MAQAQRLTEEQINQIMSDLTPQEKDLVAVLEARGDSREEIAKFIRDFM